jgi:hypothetical protein
VPRYTYLIYDVNSLTCVPNSPVEYWSYTSYAAPNYVNINFSGDLKYIESSGHSNFTNEITSLTVTSCTVPPTPTPTPTATPTPTPIPPTPTPTPTATPTPTPNPSPTLSVGSGCTDYAGTGYITVSASGGSGDYTYHISTSPPPPFNGENSASSLSNATYYVGAYDNVYGTSTVTTVGINCPPAPTPTPTPTPTATPTPTPTPTTVVSYEFPITTSWGDSASACADSSTATNIYGSSPSFLSNSQFYSDPSLTSPYGGGSSFYKNTANGQYVQIDGSGYQIAGGTC